MEAILRLPAPVRHALMVAAAVVLTWAGTEWLPVLENESNLTGSVAAAVLTYAIAWATPLVSSYGVGAGEAHRMGARTPSEGTGVGGNV